MFSAAAPPPAGCRTALAAPCNAQTTAVPCTVQLLLELAFFKESLEAFLQPPVSGMFATAEDMLAAKFAGGVPAGGPAGAEALAAWVDPQVSTRCTMHQHRMGCYIRSNISAECSAGRSLLREASDTPARLSLNTSAQSYTLMRVARRSAFVGGRCNITIFCGPAGRGGGRARGAGGGGGGALGCSKRGVQAQHGLLLRVAWSAWHPGRSGRGIVHVGNAAMGKAVENCSGIA